MKASIILLVVLMVTGLLRKRSAALRHWILAVAVACACAVPAVEAFIPSWPVFLGASTFFGPSTLSELTAASEAPRGVPDASLPVAPRGTPDRGSPHDRSAGDRLRDSAVVAVLGRVWIVGTTMSLVVLGIGLGRLAWLRSRSRRVTDSRWIALAHEISRDYGLRRPVHLRQSQHPSLLATWGAVSPTIVFPAVSERWPDDLVRVVLRHELAHVKRGDWMIQMLAEILRAAYWFNPIVWLTCRRLRLESERACDDVVLRHGVQASAYATHLLDLARALNQRRAWVPAPAMARPSSLHKRVIAMLNDHQNRSPMSMSVRAATALALAIVTGAVAAAQVFATFSGSLVDPQGAALPGVRVMLTNADRQMKYEAQSNRGGEFEFVGLPPGDYAFQAEMPGFRPYRATLSMTGANAHRAITLQIGSLEETVTIADGDDAPSAPVQVNSPRAIPPCPATAAGGGAPIGGNIRPPRRIRDARPQYPAKLRGTGAEGTVVLDGRIGLDGFIKEVRVHEPANREFADALVTAVSQWQWDSTLLNCVPTEVAITVTGKFVRR